MKHTGHGSADLNEPKQSQPTPSEESLIAKLRRYHKATRPGYKAWPDNTIFGEAADLLEQQASALKEWQSKYEAEHRALLERVNFTGANELEKTAIIARQASALKTVDELCGNPWTGTVEVGGRKFEMLKFLLSVVGFE
jgi:hypothetical protein